jgi:NADPH:quinone reductase-like Zn-dependent oxidoreductase
LVRSLGADHVVDYTKEDFTRAEQRYDVILDNVMNHPPFATARVLTPTGLPIPNSFGNAGGWLAGLPRMARATLMGRGSTRVQSVTCEVNRENLAALATLLESGDARRVIDHLYALNDAASAIDQLLAHHARGKVAIVVWRGNAWNGGGPFGNDDPADHWAASGRPPSTGRIRTARCPRTGVGRFPKGVAEVPQWAGR